MTRQNSAVPPATRVARPRLSRSGLHATEYAFARDWQNHALVAERHLDNLSSPAGLPPNSATTATPTFTQLPQALFQSSGSSSSSSTTTTTITSRLRLDNDLLGFSLLPRDLADLQRNQLIHAAARDAQFDAAVANALLRTNLIAIALPHDLSALLAATSPEVLAQAIVEILALIIDGEDDAAVLELSEEVEPSVWQALQHRRASGRPITTRAPPQVMQVVEAFVRLCYHTPWQIPVQCLHVTPDDLFHLIHGGSNPALSFSHSHKNKPHDPSAKAAAIWNLFLAWSPVRAALVDKLGLPGRTAATALLDAEAVGFIESAWSRANFVVAASCIRYSESNLFASLPQQLVAQVLAPHVLYAGLSVPEPSLRIDMTDD